MNKSNILEVAIRKAVINGFGYKGKYTKLEVTALVPEEIDYDHGTLSIRWYWNGGSTYIMCGVLDLLFNKEFAKALFGDKLLCYDCGEEVSPPDMIGNIQIGTGNCSCARQYENNEPAFEYHLKQMILTDFFSYLEDFI